MVGFNVERHELLDLGPPLIRTRGCTDVHDRIWLGYQDLTGGRDCRMEKCPDGSLHAGVSVINLICAGGRGPKAVEARFRHAE